MIMRPRAGRRQTKTQPRRRANRLCYKEAHADHRIHPQRQRRPPAGGHRTPGAGHSRDAGRPPARPFRRRLAQPLGVHARRRRSRRSKPRSSRSLRSPSTPSTCATHRGEHPRLGAVDVVPFVPIEGVTMAECVALAKDVGAAGGRTLPGPRLSLRGSVDQPGAEEPRRHPPRRVRRAGGEDGVGRLGAGLRPGLAARDRRRLGLRRAHAAHRLQHQPQHRSTGCREEDCRRDPPQQRRAPIREGDGREARRPQPGAGVDEPDQLREDAGLPRLRDGEARSRTLRRAHPRERDRRPCPGGRARALGRVLPAARALQRRADPREEAAAG